MRQGLKTKRPRKSRSPHPKRGTPAGDAVMGACVACGEEICRGDAFVVNVAGPIMHIGECVQAFLAGPSAGWMTCAECKCLIDPTDESIIGEVPFHKACGQIWIEREFVPAVAAKANMRIADDSDPF
jgi:hypothetical protein